MSEERFSLNSIKRQPDRLAFLSADDESRDGLTPTAGGSIITDMKVQDVTKEYFRSAAPGTGVITFETGYKIDLHREETDMAHWLHGTFGGDITLLREINEQRVKTADYLWRGRFWDLKTLTTEKAANFALRKGLQQIRENPGGIILDYRGADIDLNILASVIEKRFQWRRSISVIDIMIVLNDSVQIWRY